MDPIEAPVPPVLKRRRTTVALDLSFHQKFQGILITLMAILAPLRFLAASDFVPFFVHITRKENHWRSTDVAIMFLVFSTSMMLSPFLFAFVASKKSYWQLIFLHGVIIVGAGFGGFLMRFPDFFFPESHIVVPFSVAMGLMGLSMDRANIEAWIPEVITSNGGNQKQISYWTSQGAGAGYLVTDIFPPIIFEFLGFNWNIYASMLGSVLPLLCLVILIVISEPIDKRSMGSMSLSLLSSTSSEDEESEVDEVPDKGIFTEMSPSLYVLEIGATWSQATIQYLYAYLLPAIIVKQLNTHVSYIAVSSGCSTFTAIVVTYVLATKSGIWENVNLEYPWDICVALLVHGLGLVFFSVENFNSVPVALVGLFLTNLGFSFLDTFEAPQRTLLAPPWALTKIIGIVNGGKRSLRLVVAGTGPFMEAWSVRYSSLIFSVVFFVTLVAMVLVHRIRVRKLERLVYFPKSENLDDKSEENLARLLAERKEEVPLPYLEMEQMKYAGLTYDMLDDENSRLSLRGFDDFEELTNFNLVRNDSSRAIEPDFAVPLLEVFNADLKHRHKKKNDGNHKDDVHL